MRTVTPRLILAAPATAPNIICPAFTFTANGPGRAHTGRLWFALKGLVRDVDAGSLGEDIKYPVRKLNSSYKGSLFITPGDFKRQGGTALT